MDEPTWRLVRHGARTLELPGGALPARRPRRRRAGDPAPPRPPAGRARARSSRGCARRSRASCDERAPALMAILGEPGIGKSRLAAELPALAGAEGRVLTGPLPGLRRGRHLLAAARDRRAGAGRAHGGRARGRARGRAGGGATRWRRRSASRRAGGRGARLGVPPARSRRSRGRSRCDGGRRRAPGRARAARAAARRRRPGRGRAGAGGLVARPDLRAAPSAPAHGRACSSSARCPTRPAPRSGSIAAGRLRARASGGASPAPPAATRSSSSSSWPTSASSARRPGCCRPALHALLAARLDRLGDGRAVGARARRDRGRRVRARPVHALAEGMTRAELEQACERLVERDSAAERPGDGRRDAVPPRARARGGLRVAGQVGARAPARAPRGLARRPRRRSCRRPTRGSASTSRPRAATRAEVGGGALAELLRRAGDRLAAAARVARGRGDLLGEIGFLDRAVALLRHERSGARRCCRRWCRRCPTRAPPSGPSTSRSRPWRRAPRCGLAGRRRAVGDRARADPALPPPGALRRARRPMAVVERVDRDAPRARATSSGWRGPRT